MAACKAPDGSYWALQSWQRELANYGVPPTPAQSVLSCGSRTGPATLPVLEITMDWSYKKRRPPLRHLHATTASASTASASTSAGDPLDSFGRNIYVDTFDSAYGSGWKRENSFLTHAAERDVLLRLLRAHGSHPAGNGTSYRAT